MRISILVALIILAALVSSLGFTPAVLADKDNDGKFTAAILLRQDKVVNVPLGGNKWRTTEELFSGNVTSSSWPAIAGAAVKMNGTTDYTVSPPTIPGGFSDIKGTTRQTMEIITGTGTLTIRGSGKIEGTIPFGALINMEWESVSGTGSMKKVEVESKMKANFSWMTLPPSGTAAMNGTHEKDD